ncbi:MAG: DNA repair protein RadC [Caldimonas sp.]
MSNAAAASRSTRLFVEELEGTYRLANTDEVIGSALAMVSRRYRSGTTLAAPQAAREYLALRLGTLEHEVFACIFLDAQNRIIEYVELFRGTVTQTAVYPREVVKEALRRNAVALVLVHNHPSGCGEPSRADEYLTQTLKAALALVDVRILDHIIVGGIHLTSLAERGLL